MDLNLKGKNALVCGGSSGIGKATAIELSRLGANVTLLARNAASLGDAISALHHEPGQEHDFIIADMSDHQDLHQKIYGLTTQKNPHPGQ